MQGKLPPTYDHKDLLELGRVTFNHISHDDEGWITNDSNAYQNAVKGAPSDEKNFLALATELISSFKKNNGSGSTFGGKGGSDGKESYLPWSFENPKELKTTEVKGTIMRWCTNDYHPQPMWYGRKTCLNKAEFTRKMEESQKKGWKFEPSQEGKTGKSTDYKPTSEFKIALAAMCSEDDYELLEKQFFSKN